MLDTATRYRGPSLPSERDGTIRRLRGEVRSLGLGGPSPTRSVLWCIGVPSAWVVAYVAANGIGHPLGWLAAWSLQALLTLSAAAGMHDATHRNLFASSWANHVAGQLWGSMLLAPYGIYRAAHLQHHVATHEDGDSEPLDFFRGVAEYVLMGVGAAVLYLGANWAWALRTAVGRPPAFVRTSQQRRIALVSSALAAVVLGLAVAATIAAPRAMLLGYFVPFALGALVLAMVLLPEHYLCPLGPASALDTTRTTVSNRLVRFFFWNTNFHTAHHLFANVPAHRLGPVNDLVLDEVRHVESGYLRWHRELFRLLATRQHPAEQLRVPS